LVCFGVLMAKANTEKQNDGLPLQVWKAANARLPLIIYLSGDGEYNAFSKSIMEKIRAVGYGVWMLDSKSTFGKLKRPNV